MTTEDLNKTSPQSSAMARMKYRMAGILVGKLVNDCQLTIQCGDGTPSLVFGSRSNKHFIMQIDRPLTLWDIMTDPDPMLGESYMDGRWYLEKGDIGEFVTMLARGRDQFFEGPMGHILGKIINKRPDDYDHSPEASYGQIQHHYDISNDLYRLFLDEGMNYSCAFFEMPAQSLRDAQLNKIKTSIERLDVSEGMKVLDIGCGWGETTRSLAQDKNAEVTGVTLSKQQFKLGQEKANQMDSKNKPSYYLQDYREHALTHQNYYDRIISIGMFEHVGDKNFGQYFKTVHDQLKPGGKALIHSIVRSGEPSTADLSSPWLDKYIFPGGCLCEIEDMVEEAENQGLSLAHEPFVQDSFHYAETLRRWRANFIENYHQLDSKVYDERFYRMWIYYLAMCEAMFAGCEYRVAQILFTKPT